MSESLEYDFVVIGTGPGGEGAAMKAAKAGKRVAAIEQFTRVGGACINWGTIPSKALRRAIYHMDLISQSPVYKRLDVAPDFSLPEMLQNTAEIVDMQAEMRQNFYDRNDVALIPGRARFVDAHTIHVENGDGGKKVIKAAAFVIATGARPYRPKDLDFNHPRIRDSNTILTMDYTPKTVAVYGAGVIGCEYASMLRVMRCKLTLINTKDRLLDFLDEEITDALSYHFADKGIRIMHQEEYEKIEAHNDYVAIHLKSGKQVKADVLVWTAGRMGNSDDMGLETVGVVTDKRGNIQVNRNFQTAQPHIYAVGDIVGPPGLASASYDQGRFVATHYVDPTTDRKLIEDIPAGIYTLPEISCLGKTEAQLTAEKVPYEVAKAKFNTLARAQITGQKVGMLKMLFHRETLALLAIHCFGENAAEIIHIGQAIMSQPPPNNTIEYFVSTTFNYPTMAEAYRVAALDGMERL